MSKLSGLLLSLSVLILTPFVLSGCGEEKAMNVQIEMFEFPAPDPQVWGAWVSVAWPFGGNENPNNWVGWDGPNSGGIAGSFCGGNRNHTHSGADRAARDLSRAGCDGVSVYAGISGRIVQAVASCSNIMSDCNGGYGNTVVIYDHSRRVALRYSHLSSVTVSVGDEVTVGTRIGKVGKSGNVTGPHLHLAAYENIDHWRSYPNDPVIPTLCDSEWYTCSTYFYCW